MPRNKRLPTNCFPSIPKERPADRLNILNDFLWQRDELHPEIRDNKENTLYQLNYAGKTKEPITQASNPNNNFINNNDVVMDIKFLTGKSTPRYLK